jgi:hypothetical protein
MGTNLGGWGGSADDEKIFFLASSPDIHVRSEMVLRRVVGRALLHVVVRLVVVFLEPLRFLLHTLFDL